VDPTASGAYSHAGPLDNISEMDDEVMDDDDHDYEESHYVMRRSKV